MARAAGRAIDVVVKSGPHHGAIEALTPGKYRIGSGFESDLLLVGPDIAPIHCLIEFDGARVSVAGIAGETRFRRRANLRPAERRLVRLPVSLTVGGTDLGIRWHRANPDRGRWQSAAAGLMVAAASVVLLYGTDRLGGAELAAAFLPTSEGAPPSTVDALVGEVTPAPSSERKVRSIATNADAGAIAAKLQERVAAADLSDQVEVVIENGVIVARGQVDPSAADRWLAVQTWFDGQVGQRVLLVRQVEIVQQQNAPRLSVKAVWTGAVPYIVTGDGEKYGEGAVLDGGWIIERIEQKKIVLRQGGRTLALDL